MGLFDVLRGERAQQRVELSDVGVTRYFGDGRSESVSWAELERVEVISSSDAPVPHSWFFLLYGPHGTGCVVPEGFGEALVERLVQLPGFDRAALVEAAESSEGARVQCWSRPEEPAIAAPPSVAHAE
jgi:hypothetical protein